MTLELLAWSPAHVGTNHQSNAHMTATDTTTTTTTAFRKIAVDLSDKLGFLLARLPDGHDFELRVELPPHDQWAAVVLECVDAEDAVALLPFIKRFVWSHTVRLERHTGATNASIWLRILPENL